MSSIGSYKFCTGINIGTANIGTTNIGTTKIGTASDIYLELWTQLKVDPHLHYYVWEISRSQESAIVHKPVFCGDTAGSVYCIVFLKVKTHLNLTVFYKSNRVADELSYKAIQTVCFLYLQNGWYVLKTTKAMSWTLSAEWFVLYQKKCFPFLFFSSYIEHQGTSGDFIMENLQ